MTQLVINRILSCKPNKPTLNIFYRKWFMIKALDSSQTLQEDQREATQPGKLKENAVSNGQELALPKIVTSDTWP